MKGIRPSLSAPGLVTSGSTAAAAIMDLMLVAFGVQGWGGKLNG